MYTKILQSDQKVSVHLMITIQKVTSNVQSVPRQSPDIYWHAELCSKTVFSIARSTFRMYSVMAILTSSAVWAVFEYWVFHRTETFWSPCIILFDYKSRLPLSPNRDWRLDIVPCSKMRRIVSDQRKWGYYEYRGDYSWFFSYVCDEGHYWRKDFRSWVRNYTLANSLTCNIWLQYVVLRGLNLRRQVVSILRILISPTAYSCEQENIVMFCYIFLTYFTACWKELLRLQLRFLSLCDLNYLNSVIFIWIIDILCEFFSFALLHFINGKWVAVSVMLFFVVTVICNSLNTRVVRIAWTRKLVHFVLF
jgi:hypothetical protein